MRNHIASLFVLFLGTAAGCGEVEDSSCPGEQSDNVACTLDVCNAEGGGWAHIPNNNLCEAGQACSPTAGCVAGGSLAGTAKLLGKTDHSGITVTVNGVEGATATTDAAGAWSILIPPGRYTVTYSKDKYISETSPDIVVVADAADVVPEVELAHGEELGFERPITGGYSSFQNVDKSYLIEVVGSAFGNAYWATPMDGSTGPSLIVASPNQIFFTSTHAVWTESNIVFSRPLTAATEAISLSSTISGGSLSIVGTPGTYTVIRRTRPLPTYHETSLYIARTDGSTPAGTAVWTQPDAQHTYFDFVNGDTYGLLSVQNSTNNNGPPGDAAAQTPIHRIDFAANTSTALNIGFAASWVDFRSVSPDASRVYGHVYTQLAPCCATPFEQYRGFIGSIASGAMTMSPSTATSTYYSVFHDYGQYFDGWTPDNTLIFRTTSWYNGSGNVGGELKAWFANGTLATFASNPSTYYNFNPVLLNGAIAWRDSGSLRVAGITTSPTAYTLDSSGLVSGFWAKAGTGATGSYVAWTQVPAGTQLPNKVFGANIPTTVTSLPPTVQLGPNIPATCSFEGALAGTTYFALCPETGTLTSYAAASNTPAGSTSGVHGSLFLVGSDRVGFRKTDGSVYSTSNSGTFADLKAIATKVDGNSPLPVVGSWMMYRDATAGLTRVSKLDGSIIDEPLSDCDLTVGGAYTNTSMSQLFVASARCTNIDYGMFRAPTANLP